MKLLQSLLLIVLVSPYLYQATAAKASNSCCTHRQRPSHLSLLPQAQPKPAIPVGHYNQHPLVFVSHKPSSHLLPFQNFQRGQLLPSSPLPASLQPPAINRPRCICHCTVVSATNSVSHDSCFVSELIYIYQPHYFRHRRPQAVYSLHRAPLRLGLRNEESSQIPPDFRGRNGRHWSVSPCPANSPCGFVAQQEAIRSVLAEHHLRPGGDLPQRRALLHDAAARAQPHPRPVLHAPLYYFNVKAIAINGALALNFPANHRLVKLSTVAPYTCRPIDLYRTFINAFAMAT